MTIFCFFCDVLLCYTMCSLNTICLELHPNEYEEHDSKQTCLHGSDGHQGQYIRVYFNVSKEILIIKFQ